MPLHTQKGCRSAEKQEKRREKNGRMPAQTVDKALFSRLPEKQRLS